MWRLAAVALVWDRNSFENTIPFTEVAQEKPIEIDPPLVIPKQLKPLGSKRRYLRSMQLITDPLPVAAMREPLLVTPQNSVNNRLLPFEQSLRQNDSSRPRQLVKSNSHAVVLAPGATSKKTDGVEDEDCGEMEAADSLPNDVVEEVDDGIGKRRIRQRANTGDFQTKPHALVWRDKESPLDRPIDVFTHLHHFVFWFRTHSSCPRRQLTLKRVTLVLIDVLLGSFRSTK